MQSLIAPSRPVLLTGYDLELECPKCHERQVVGDATTSAKGCGDEYVALHALPGKYILTYRLHCWGCNDFFGGRLTIRSRSAPDAAQAG